MSEWKPRPHDHLVEPVFVGLDARHDRDPHLADALLERAASRRLAIGALVALAVVIARLLLLLAR